MKRYHETSAEAHDIRRGTRRDNTRGADAKQATIARRQARKNKRALCYGMA